MKTGLSILVLAVVVASANAWSCKNLSQFRECYREVRADTSTTWMTLVPRIQQCCEEKNQPLPVLLPEVEEPVHPVLLPEVEKPEVLPNPVSSESAKSESKEKKPKPSKDKKPKKGNKGASSSEEDEVPQPVLFGRGKRDVWRKFQNRRGLKMKKLRSLIDALMGMLAEGVERDTADEPAVPGTADEPVPGSADEPVVPGTADEPVVPGTADEPVPGTADEPVSEESDESKEKKEKKDKKGPKKDRVKRWWRPFSRRVREWYERLFERLAQVEDTLDEVESEEVGPETGDEKPVDPVVLPEEDTDDKSTAKGKDKPKPAKGKDKPKGKKN